MYGQEYKSNPVEFLLFMNILLKSKKKITNTSAIFLNIFQLIWLIHSKSMPKCLPILVEWETPVFIRV